MAGQATVRDVDHTRHLLRVETLQDLEIAVLAADGGTARQRSVFVSHGDLNIFDGEVYVLVDMLDDILPGAVKIVDAFGKSGGVLDILRGRVGGEYRDIGYVAMARSVDVQDCSAHKDIDNFGVKF